MADVAMACYSLRVILCFSCGMVARAEGSVRWTFVPVLLPLPFNLRQLSLCDTSDNTAITAEVLRSFLDE